jgi:hypothetical protein
LAGVKAAELTVFAATNDAYGNSALRSAEEETGCEYVEIDRHIVEGKYTRSELTDSLFLTALDGTRLLVTRMGERIYINGVELVDAIPVGDHMVYIVENAICTEPQTPEKPVVPVTGVIVNQPVLSIETGKTEYVSVTVLPMNASEQRITWRNSMPEVVEMKALNGIDSLFSLTALSAGTAVITFTAMDGEYAATCTVTVSDESGDEMKFFSGLLRKPAMTSGNSSLRVLNENSSASLTNHEFSNK